MKILEQYLTRIFHPIYGNCTICRNVWDNNTHTHELCVHMTVYDEDGDSTFTSVISVTAAEYNALLLYTTRKG